MSTSLENNNPKISAKESKDKIIGTSISKVDKSLDATDVRLTVHLGLRDKYQQIVVINQDIKIPYIKSPAFIQDSYDHVKQILNVMCLDTFERVAKDFFRNCMEESFTKKQFFSDEKTVVSFPETEETTVPDNGFPINIVRTTESPSNEISLDVEEQNSSKT